MVRDTLLHLLPEEQGDSRGLPVPRLVQLCTALRFYATGSFQIVGGDLHNIHQTTVSRIIKVVSQNISRHLPRYIQMPVGEDLQQTKRMFWDIAHFPNIVGCIDCTHIPVKSPGGENPEVYRNRKGWMSLNVQVVGRPQYKILDIVIRWPGSAHDREVLKIAQ